MKVLFLDFDGVLNSMQSTMYWDGRCEEKDLIHKLCPIATSNLKFILEKIPDMNIVISSTWRKVHDFEWLKETLASYGVQSERVIGITPELRRERLSQHIQRGQEIDRFIKDWHERGFDRIEDFIILDDNSDMEPHMEKLIQTDPQIGFSWLEVEEIADRFQIDKMPVVCF